MLNQSYFLFPRLEFPLCLFTLIRHHLVHIDVEIVLSGEGGGCHHPAPRIVFCYPWVFAQIHQVCAWTTGKRQKIVLLANLDHWIGGSSRWPRTIVHRLGNQVVVFVAVLGQRMHIRYFLSLVNNELDDVWGLQHQLDNLGSIILVNLNEFSLLARVLNLQYVLWRPVISWKSDYSLPVWIEEEIPRIFGTIVLNHTIRLFSFRIDVKVICIVICQIHSEDYSPRAP